MRIAERYNLNYIKHTTLTIFFVIIAIVIAYVSIAFGDVNKDILTTQTVEAVEEAPIKEVEAILSPVQYADKYAAQYGIDPVVFKKVMWCESSNDPNAVGDSGKARNVLQFHKDTFDTYSKQIADGLNYDSYKDQIQVGAYMFSIGQARHWTAYRAYMNGGSWTFWSSKLQKNITVYCK